MSPKRANPCDNCAMTLPRRQEAPDHRSSPGADAPNPTLRTRAPYARVLCCFAGDDSPPASQTTCSSDAEGDDESRPSTLTGAPEP